MAFVKISANRTEKKHVEDVWYPSYMLLNHDNQPQYIWHAHEYKIQGNLDGTNIISKKWSSFLKSDFKF